MFLAMAGFTKFSISPCAFTPDRLPNGVPDSDNQNIWSESQYIAIREIRENAG
jgi:hypothetical protein